MMSIDFSVYPLVHDAFTAQPLSFVSGAVSTDLARLVEIDLIENGLPSVRSNWQSKQLVNLFQHARQRSPFWRKRLPSGILNASILPQLSLLTRGELVTQIDKEGTLVPPPKGTEPMRGNLTSGSTGTPLQVYTLPQIGYLNSIRSLYEYFRGGWPITENKTRLRMLRASSPGEKNKIEKSPNWIGGLSEFFKNGIAKELQFDKFDNDIRKSLESEPIGYLVSGATQFSKLLTVYSPHQLRDLGMKAWIQFGASINPDYVEPLHQVGIKTHSNYSCEEIGPIAEECFQAPGFYHVAHSNVIVEEDRSQMAEMEGEQLSRVLVTHLHSYATPIIRYELGDFAKFHDRCPCGHAGTVLSKIYGRGKHFIHHRDGRLTEFFIGPRHLKKIFEFKEWRFIQTDFNQLNLEVSGTGTLTDEQKSKIEYLVKSIAGPDFTLSYHLVDDIDWSDNPKRLAFVSRIEQLISAKS